MVHGPQHGSPVVLGASISIQSCCSWFSCTHCTAFSGPTHDTSGARGSVTLGRYSAVSLVVSSNSAVEGDDGPPFGLALKVSNVSQTVDDARTAA